MDFELITTITDLPLAGLDTTPFFTGKEKDNVLMNKLKDKSDLNKDNRGFFIPFISDHIVRSATKVLLMGVFD